ncbi:MAG: STT3 domain-containing protein, partial [archaeon]
MSDSINIDKKKIINFFKDNKVQIVLTAILFLIILISSFDIRLSNLPLLKDKTSGKYISTDLDSLYFYREAQTILTNGHLPVVDILRAPVQNTTWIPETLPYVLVGLYKVITLFSPSMTFDYFAAISGPIIYGFGLIIFFFLCFLLTKSKTASLISVTILAYAPMYLFRTSAGFYDHDHLGVTFLFIFLLVLVLALRKLENGYKEAILGGIAIGIATAAVLTSWGGAITFVVAVFPLTCLLYYLIHN